MNCATSANHIITTCKCAILNGLSPVAVIDRAASVVRVIFSKSTTFHRKFGFGIIGI